MYRAHWGLEKHAFAGSFDPADYYANPTHDEALARVHYLVENQRRVGLLLGGNGCGKSALLGVMARECAGAGIAVANLNLLGLVPEELEWKVAEQLGLNPRSDQPSFHVWRALADRLVEHRYQQRTTLVLLDDADSASEEVLTHVVRLSQLDPSPAALLTIILAAEVSRANQIGQRLLDLAELRIEIEPWQEAETSRYLQHCLAAAGCTEAIFDPAAIRRMHQLCHGVPRQVNQLAHLALIAAAGEQLPTVDEKTVEAVYHELVVTAPVV